MKTNSASPSPATPAKERKFPVLGAIVAMAVIAAAAYLAVRAPEDKGPSGPPPKAPTVLIAGVETVQWDEIIQALGTVRANESATLSSKVTERVVAIEFEDGQTVKAGQVLVRLNDAEQQAALKEAQAQLDERYRQLERIRQVEGSGALSRSVIDEEITRYNTAEAQLELVAARLDDRVITAPFDGVLGLRSVSPGTLVESGDPLVTIVDLTPVKIDFTVPERYFARIAPDMEIRARSEAYPGREFTGTVQSISPNIDPVSRSVQVRALASNEDLALRPGMLLQIRLNLGTRDTIIVPESALSPIGDQQYAYRLDPGDTARQIPVQIGRRRQGAVEILDGLNAGERVIAQGYLVRDGQTVNVADETDPTTR